MAVQLIVNVDDPDDLIAGYGAGALVRLERATSSAFTDSLEIDTEPLVSGTTQYKFWDTAGTDAHWYRSRYSDSTGTTFSEYSDGFQPGSPHAYATVDSLRELLQLPDDSRDNVLSDLLVRVTDQINLTLGFDFFRHPAVSGTEVRTLHGDGSDTITFKQGIYSLTSVQIGTGTGAAYSALTSADWRLRWPLQDGGPYLALQLTGVGNYPIWYTGFDTVELTGVFGYPSIPPAIEQATLLWAAALFRFGSGGHQTGASFEEFEIDNRIRYAAGAPWGVKQTLDEYRAKHKGWMVV